MVNIEIFFIGKTSKYRTELTINVKRENINDYVIDDFEVRNYKHHEVIKMKMVA
jgi:thymidylate synthase